MQRSMMAASLRIRPPPYEFKYLGLLTVYGQPKPAWYAAKSPNFDIGR
jgi:hypothetical protein